MTKKEIAQAQAVKTLQEWGVTDGTVIYAKVTRVSASGMNRRVQLFFVLQEYQRTDTQHPETNIPEFCRSTIIEISYHAAKVLGWNYKDGYNGGISVSGCGMDMLFHTIDCLSYEMGYGDICQDRNRRSAIEKGGKNGIKIQAIGLKYAQL